MHHATIYTELHIHTCCESNISYMTGCQQCVFLLYFSSAKNMSCTGELQNGFAGSMMLLSVLSHTVWSVNCLALSFSWPSPQTVHDECRGFSLTAVLFFFFVKGSISVFQHSHSSSTHWVDLLPPHHLAGRE